VLCATQPVAAGMFKQCMLLRHSMMLVHVTYRVVLGECAAAAHCARVARVALVNSCV